VVNTSIFDEHGWCLPVEGARVFSIKPNYYYRLEQPSLDFSRILKRLKNNKNNDFKISANEFEKKTELILNKLRDNTEYKNITKGVYVPFVYKRALKNFDIGLELIDHLLPSLQKSFKEHFSQSNFKTILQGNSILPGNITIEKHSRYYEFIKDCEHEVVVGIYFPQALQQYDVYSQRFQMTTLPVLDNLRMCLSGGIDICTALTGSPELLISNKFYTPIPILSAYVHNDVRMVLMVKSYGPNLEFWCMSQMLTRTLTQVSEQWSGGMTVW